MFDVISIGSCIAELTPVQPGLPLAQARLLQAFPSGAAANFVFAAARLDLRPALVSRVGEDELGSFIISALHEGGVDTSHIFSTPGQFTSLSLCWADGRGEKFFYHYRFPDFCEPLEKLASTDLDDSFLIQGKLLHFSEACVRNPRLRPVTFEIASRFAALGGRLLYCPNYRGVWRSGEADMLATQRHAIGLADWVILNEEEARIITGASPVKAGRLLRSWGPDVVVITAGEKGARIFSQEESGFIPAYPFEVVYDVGAGDTFQAGFVAGHQWGKSYLDSVRAGAAAAALRISRSGDPAQLPTAEEVKELLDRL